MREPGRGGPGLAADGLLVVDKPGGWTSHDVVARVRRLAGTRRVGHAGTLDPMATGVLVLGIGRATRLLGHLALTEKEYTATVRLGLATTTDDAEGEPLGGSPADTVDASMLAGAVAALTGEIDQVPSAVSAIKVGGVRSYVRARAGEAVALPARRVTVSRLTVVGVRPAGDGLRDVDVEVTCSSGTYIRAIARDLGQALGVGGHLTALRRTRVGPFGLDAAQALASLGSPLDVLPLAAAVARSFPRRDVDLAAAQSLRHGRPLPPTGTAGPVGVFDPDDAVLALVEDRDGAARPLVVFAPG